MKTLLDSPYQTIVQLLQRKKDRCNSTNTQFGITTFSQLVEVVGDGKCAYTGKYFANWQCATFERINPKIGYMPGNVVLVTLEANSHKSQLDAFIKGEVIPDAMKIKLLRKALYALEKEQQTKP